jgi:uncharacterized membrane protein
MSNQVSKLVAGFLILIGSAAFFVFVTDWIDDGTIPSFGIVLGAGVIGCGIMLVLYAIQDITTEDKKNKIDDFPKDDFDGK